MKITDLVVSAIFFKLNRDVAGEELIRKPITTQLEPHGLHNNTIPECMDNGLAARSTEGTSLVFRSA